MAACSAWGSSPHDELVENVARSLGADVAFFLRGGCGLYEGKGDRFVQALEAGGDDFITKPFDNKVLEARIQASLRRFRQQGQTPAGPGGRCGDFCLDAAGRTVSLPGGGQAHLSATEYRILSFLMEHIGQCFTIRELYVRIWGEKSLGDTRTVVVHIHNLRAKIEPVRVRPT